MIIFLDNKYSISRSNITDYVLNLSDKDVKKRIRNKTIFFSNKDKYENYIKQTAALIFNIEMKEYLYNLYLNDNQDLLEAREVAMMSINYGLTSTDYSILRNKDRVNKYETINSKAEFYETANWIFLVTLSIKKFEEKMK